MVYFQGRGGASGVSEAAAFRLAITPPPVAATRPPAAVIPSLFRKALRDRCLARLFCDVEFCRGL